MLKVLVFDLDGTITHLTLPLEAMRRDTKAYYISKGLPSETFESADGISSSTGKARTYFLNISTNNPNQDITNTAVEIHLHHGGPNPFSIREGV